MTKTLLEQFNAARAAGVPLLAAETPDSDALIERLLGVDVEIQQPAVCWDFCRGMRPLNPRGEKIVGQIVANDPDIGGTIDPTVQNPAAAVLAVGRMRPTDDDGVLVFLQMAHRFFDDVGFLQALRNVRDSLKADGRLLVLLGESMRLPLELRGHVVVLDEPLPDDAELLAIARTVYEDNAESMECKLDAAQLGRVAETLRGTFAFGAETLAAMSLRSHGFDHETLQIHSRRLIEETLGLSVDRGGETFGDIGGLDQAKLMGTLRFNGKRRPRLVVRIEELEKAMAGAKGDLSGTSTDILQVLLSEMEDNQYSGMLAFGAAGAGKSLYAKSLANTFDVLPMRLDVNGCKGSLVGQSLHPDEDIYVCRRKGGFDVERMSIAHFHERYRDGDQDWYTWSYSDCGGATVNRITNSFKHVRRERFLRIRTKSGREVRVTAGHSVFTRRKMENPGAAYAFEKEATPQQKHECGRAVGLYTNTCIFNVVRSDELKIGDAIAVARNLYSCANVTRVVSAGMCDVHVNEQLAEILGLWLADGSFADRNYRLSVADIDEEIVPMFEDLCGRQNLTVYQNKAGKSFDILVKQSHWLNSAMTLLGMKGRSRTKRIPGWVFGCSPKVVGAFLRGYFSGDGSISGHVIEASTMSPRLADDLLLLLTRIGIFARRRKRYLKDHKVLDGKTSPEGWQHRITISKGSELESFRTKVGFLQSYKTDKLNAECVRLPHQKYVAGKRFNAVMWDPIELIEEIDGPGVCYDIEVEGTQRFLAGGIVVHNSEANIRAAMKVIHSIGGNDVFFVASMNRMDIPAELRRRFRAGVWFFDTPDKVERGAIWGVQTTKYGLGSADWQSIDEDDMTGADIRNICELAHDLDISLAEALEFTVLLKHSAPESIQEARRQADGRYNSASYKGRYRMDKEEAKTNAKPRRQVNLRAKGIG